MFKIKKISLVFITGALWLAVGIMLISRVLFWFPGFSLLQSIIAAVASLALAFIKTRFVFIKVTDENIKRIINIPGIKVSVFAFHTLKFYFLILIMIGFGIFMRNTEFIPNIYIFPIYIGVGSAMIYASFMYFKYSFQNK
ncbi:MAG: hypothetical protein L3J35_00755 [Bacteroidales bacterium]|nr:hypothetical protein [Bacteroidales bacterium]